MRPFSSEFAQDYSTYSFGYANYLEREPGDALADIYGRGYLPYSGAPNASNIFYMARSARVPLAELRTTSENKRIGKRFDGAFEKERIPAARFAADSAFLDFFSGYFAARHGERVMPKERVGSLFESGLVADVIVYRASGEPVAYVLEVAEGEMAHFWYSAYDLDYANRSLGMWLMLDLIRDAKALGRRHYYLGTVYEEKALYKTNLEPLEFWDGSGWCLDTRALRTRSKSDASRHHGGRDEWKEKRKLF